MQRCLKSNLSSLKKSVNELILGTVVGVHLGSLLKNVTPPSQVLYKRLPRFRERLFLGELLNSCFLQNSVKSLGKKSLRRSIYIYDERKLKEISEFRKTKFPSAHA